MEGTSNVKRRIERYAERLRARIAQLEKYGADEPEGSLQVLRRGGRTYYYQRVSRDGVRKARYLSKSETALIRRLAQKRYCREVLPKLREDLRAAEAFAAIHSGVEELQAAERMDPEVRLLCGLAGRPLSKRAEEWLREGITQPGRGGSLRFESGLRFKTLYGTMVRSKSEAMIEDALVRHGLIYRYEKPLYQSSGLLIHPDFTILDPLTMKEYYWEHFGMMDDPEYAQKVCGRIALYMAGGIMPNEYLIMTFEDRAHPFSPADADMYAQMISRRIEG